MGPINDGGGNMGVDYAVVFLIIVIKLVECSYWTMWVGMRLTWLKIWVICVITGP